MGTFATKKILQGNPSLIPVIAEQIKTEFVAEQFEVMLVFFVMLLSQSAQRRKPENR